MIAWRHAGRFHATVAGNRHGMTWGALHTSSFAGIMI